MADIQDVDDPPQAGAGAAARDEPRTCSSRACPTGLSPADGDCVFCAAHCTISLCRSPLHEGVRLLRFRPPCSLDKATVAENHDGECPCGRSLRDHPRIASQRPLDTAPPAMAPSAKLLGISVSEFATHPTNFGLDRWNELLQSIVGRSEHDRRLDHFKSSIQKERSATRVDEEVVLRDLVARCTLPGGNVREFAGLLASMTAISKHNGECESSLRITVQRDALSAGAAGSMQAEEALNEVALQRLLREGRKWFMVEVNKIREAHRSDAVNYIKLDTAKNVRRSILWTDRFTRVLLNSYINYLSSRPPTWVPSSMVAYLQAPWDLPVRDAVSPLDLTGVLVQIGVLALVEQCEQWDVLGEAVASVRAHIMAVYAAFQRDYVMTAANLFEHKQLLSACAATPASPNARAAADRNGGRVNALPPHLSSSASLASNIPAALQAGIRPDVYVYNRCQAHGCNVAPPAGFTTSRYCASHIPPPAQARGAVTGGRFGNRGGGGRAGRGNRIR